MFGDEGLSLETVAIGGGGGIRTHETVSRLAVFKTAAFNHSATPPNSPCPSGEVVL